MSMGFKRRSHEVPGLNTSSLPDLIFTVLFFFMIVTHMRHETVKVKFQVPQGKELTRLTKKSAVTYLYIGRPISAEDLQAMVVSIKADKYSKMGVIIDVKQALRQSKALRINYSAEDNGK